MTRGFGFLAVHARAIHAEPAVAARVAELLVDPRWPWPLHLVRPSQMPETPPYPWPSGKVPRAALGRAILDVLRADNTLGIHVVASRKDELNHVFAHVYAGHREYLGQPESTAYPYEAKLFCRAEHLPGASLDAWVELVHELVPLLDTPHAVIMARDDDRHIWSLLYGTGSSRPDKAADHPHNLNVRVSGARREIGADRIRPPEWGTYLSRAHVDAIGRDKLVGAAAVSREVGKLLYLQCSKHASDALAPEALERRTALAALLAPISV